MAKLLSKPVKKAFTKQKAHRKKHTLTST